DRLRWPVRVETIEWIWDRFAQSGPYGKEYTDRFRPMMRQALFPPPPVPATPVRGTAAPPCLSPIALPRAPPTPHHVPPLPRRLPERWRASHVALPLRGRRPPPAGRPSGRRTCGTVSWRILPAPP